MKSPPESRRENREAVERACRGEIHPLARKGIREYNAGEYYEAHESLELAWRDTATAERDLYQGVLQVGVAYYQIQQGNYRGALKMFQRARRLLDTLPERCRGVDVAEFRRDAERVEGALREVGPEGIEDIDTGLFQSVPLV